MILRILNGPHVGAQAEITSDPISIGSSPECDLVVMDPLLQPKHARVSLATAGRIGIQLLEGTAFVDGTAASDTAFELSLGQILTIGSTHIGFGEATAVWGMTALPEIRELGGKQESPEPEAEKPPALPVPDQPPVEDVKRKPKAFLIGLTALVVLFVAAVGTFFFLRSENADRGSIVRSQANTASFFSPQGGRNDAMTSVIDQVKQQVEQHVPSSSVSILDRGGQPFVRVYVRTRKQSEEAKRIINGAPFPVFSEIISLEEVETSANLLAEMLGYTVKASFTKDGTAYWSGYLPSTDSWHDLKVRLETDLPYIRTNETNIVYASTIEEALKAALADTPLRDRIKVESGKTNATLTGAIAPDDSGKWLETFATLKERFQQDVFLIDKVRAGTVQTLSKNPFPSPVVGVSTSSLPSVLLLNGQRLYPGAILKDGLVLASIQTDRLVLDGPNGKSAVLIGSVAPE